MKNPIDIMAKYQPYFLGLAIFFTLLAVSFTSSGNQVRLNFRNYPALIFLLVLVGIGLGLIYVSIDKHRIKKLSLSIKESSINKGEFYSRLEELTSRQKEVYEMIIAGKSNKEIMAALFIEQSTLKSHINQLYKKLEIKSRKELKSRSKA